MNGIVNGPHSWPGSSGCLESVISKYSRFVSRSRPPDQKNGMPMWWVLVMATCLRCLKGKYLNKSRSRGGLTNISSPPPEIAQYDALLPNNGVSTLSNQRWDSLTASMILGKIHSLSICTPCHEYSPSVSAGYPYSVRPSPPWKHVSSETRSHSDTSHLGQVPSRQFG